MKYLSCLVILLLAACGSLNTGNPAIDAIYTGTSAVISSDGAAEKCNQGHAQDRIDFRKRKQDQVDAINNAINNNKK